VTQFDLGGNESFRHVAVDAKANVFVATKAQVFKLTLPENRKDNMQGH